MHKIPAEGGMGLVFTIGVLAMVLISLPKAGGSWP
jgi:hypothetical protein